jgi:hypothetical protein
MLFIDKKEEVLDIQLTPHGRYLLSIGRLKPVYYSFHDQNILYDGRYADVVEYAKDVEDRIQDETPQLKTTASRVSREKNVRRMYEPLFDLSSFTGPSTAALAAVEQMSEQRGFLATDILGTSALSADKAPKWSLKALNGELTGSVPYLTASHQTLRIPQIDVDVTYKTSVFNTASTVSTELPLEPDPVLTSNIFEDGTYVVVDPDHFLFEIVEENSNYNKENVEIEVFEVLTEQMTAARSGLAGTSTLKESLRPLFFEKVVSPIQNNLLLDAEEIPETSIVEMGPNMVNYFFDVNVDNEIDPSDICEAISTLDSKNLYVNLDVSCAPAIAPSRYDIYSGPATTPCPSPTLDGTGRADPTKDCPD